MTSWTYNGFCAHEEGLVVFQCFVCGELLAYLPTTKDVWKLNIPVERGHNVLKNF